MLGDPPRGVGQAGLDLLDDGRFVVHDEDLQGVVEAADAGGGLGPGLQVDDTADALDDRALP